jgi:hypothetical protein
MRTSCHYENSPETAVEKQEAGVGWPPACNDVSPEAEECQLVEDVTKQHSED